jgi:hypothetical protein
MIVGVILKVAVAQMVLCGKPVSEMGEDVVEERRTYRR